MPDNVAPDGKIWICGACGKTIKDKYGMGGGWDESCMLNAVLITEEEAKRIKENK